MKAMGPLQGVKVIELAGIGPGPFSGMMLADMGADVIVVDRATDSNKIRLPDCNGRGKRSIALNLKNAEGIETLLKLVEQADVLFEGFRPGVAEKLGVGPDECLARNPKLVYGRMTGWGQHGPLAKTAGHDINYISLTGALYAMGRADDKPVPPLNLVGDYGGGGMFLVTGILAALYEVQRSGKGQVVDAAMTDGSAVLMAMFNSLHAMGMWSPKRGVNLLDTGAHFYETYETRDGKYISIGSIEPQFYALLIEKAQLDSEIFGDQNNPAKWPDMKGKLTDIFKTKTRDQWCELMEGSDVCFAPVLDFIEAQTHSHNVARNTYIEVDGMTQPAPAPRFSRTESQVKSGARAAGEDTNEVMGEWGFSEQQITQLRDSGALS
ncbi:MAG: CoA transferase [Proteobacteria bacterium]|nr:CoA transferase [Pseudomonadota bacterium]